jgi:hypothetical protein
MVLLLARGFRATESLLGWQAHADPLPFELSITSINSAQRAFEIRSSIYRSISQGLHYVSFSDTPCKTSYLAAAH